MKLYYPEVISGFIVCLFFTGVLNADEQVLNSQVLPALSEWAINEIKQSHVVYHQPAPLRDDPVYDADPLNLFIVVETGDHHVSILDGDRFESIHRFKTRPALQGEPEYSPDGRYVYLTSRDGWISKYDLYSLKLVVEVRSGINTRDIAISADGRYLIAANSMPHTLVILDAVDLSFIKSIPVKDASGNSSGVSAIYTAASRESFIATLKDIPELWEISYSDDPPYYGWVHDYRIEGPPEQELFPLRRILLDDTLDDYFFEQQYNILIGFARDSKKVQVIDLDIGRKISEIDLPELPRPDSAITWQRQGKAVLASPGLNNGVISVIEMEDWNIIKHIENSGPAFFLRSHENTPYAWSNVFSGVEKGAVHIIDKDSLEIVKTLRLSQGNTIRHVEFTKDGRYALLSIQENEGAIVVVDTRTLEEIKRLNMNKPSSTYNVYNQITRSTGKHH